MHAASNSPAILNRPAWPGGSAPRWIHAVACVTVVAVLPLLFLGAEVTTKRIGMVDPAGFRWPWEIFAILSESANWANSALLTELTHRLFAFLVGILSIVLCFAMLAWQRGRARWLGAAALLLVITQGLLGRYRVDLNALLGPTLAWVHGSFAPIVVATLVSVALVTSTGWSNTADASASPTLRRWSLAMVGIVYLQVILGGMVRHQPTLLAARGHLLGAFVATAGLLWLVVLAWQTAVSRWPVRLVLALLGVQVLLGVEAWMSWTKRFFLPLAADDESRTLHWLRSGHYVAGAMLFAATVVVMLQAWHAPPRKEATA